MGLGLKIWIPWIILLNIFDMKCPRVVPVVGDTKSMIMGHHVIVPGYDCLVFWTNPCYL